MEQNAMNLTEAFKILGLNPDFIYWLTFICFLFILTDNIYLAQALFLALGPAYISGFAILSILGGITCLPLNKVLLIIPIMIIIHLSLEGILGTARYAQFIYIMTDRIKFIRNLLESLTRMKIRRLLTKVNRFFVWR